MNERPVWVRGFSSTRIKTTSVVLVDSSLFSCQNFHTFCLVLKSVSLPSLGLTVISGYKPRYQLDHQLQSVLLLKTFCVALVSDFFGDLFRKSSPLLACYVWWNIRCRMIYTFWGMLNERNTIGCIRAETTF